MNQENISEAYISVDVETAGPYPDKYSLLTIGACTVGEKPRTFYIELKPASLEMTPEAYAIHHLDLQRLTDQGEPPAKAMEDFEAWLKAEVPAGQKPIFVAFNAPFDWMFVNDYFLRYLGHNPFGHSALDIKAFYMGCAGVPWAETTMRFVSARYLENRQLSHHALQDALDQALIFQKMLAEAGGRNTSALPAASD